MVVTTSRSRISSTRNHHPDADPKQLTTKIRFQKSRKIRFLATTGEVRLDHNGGRLANGGHIVWYLNFDHPHISASEWSKFLAEQEGLHKERLKKQTKSGS